MSMIYREDRHDRARIEMLEQELQEQVRVNHRLYSWIGAVSGLLLGTVLVLLFLLFAP